MAKRRRVNVGNVILLVVGLAAFIALCILSYQVVKEYFFTSGNISDRLDDVKKSDNNVKLVDYENYPKDKFDFGFLIVRVRLESDSLINLDSSDITTNEDYCLKDNEEYIRMLEADNYYIVAKNLVDSINSEESGYICSIFVPYRKDNKELTISFKDYGDITIDLTKNIKDIESFKYDDGSYIESNEFEIHVSNAYIASAMYLKDEYVDIPSSVKVYSFELEVNYIETNVTLLDAKYVTDDLDEYIALNSDYSSAETEVNMLNAELNKGNTYGLFFKVLSQDSAPVTYNGYLWLKFSNSDEWVKIPAEFK